MTLDRLCAAAPFAFERFGLSFRSWFSQWERESIVAMGCDEA
jgi:hypothetical protein